MTGEAVGQEVERQLLAAIARVEQRIATCYERFGCPACSAPAGKRCRSLPRGYRPLDGPGRVRELKSFAQGAVARGRDLAAVSIDAALNALLSEAADRGWDPDSNTVEMWRVALEALFDPRHVVSIERAERAVMIRGRNGVPEWRYT